MPDHNTTDYLDTADPSEQTIVVEDETLREGFTQIPNALLRRADITPGAKLTYMALLSYAWQKGSCFPGQDHLASDLGIGKRTVVRYLPELEEKRLLQIKRRGLGLTNIYVLPRFATSLPRPRPEAFHAGTSRSANLAHQEMPKPSSLDVPKRRREKDSVEEDSEQQHVVVNGKPKRRTTAVVQSAPTATPSVQETPGSPSWPGTEQDRITTAALEEFGVKPAVANELVSQVGATFCQQQLDWVEALIGSSRKHLPENPVAYLVAAIRDGYVAPKGLKSRPQRQAEEQSRLTLASAVIAEEERLHQVVALARKTAQERLRGQVAGQRIAGSDLTTEMAWNAALAAIQAVVSVTNFKTWFTDTLLVKVEDGQAFITTSNSFFADNLTQRFHGTVRSALERATGQILEPRFLVVDLATLEAPSTDTAPPPVPKGTRRKQNVLEHPLDS